MKYQNEYNTIKVHKEFYWSVIAYGCGLVYVIRSEYLEPFLSHNNYYLI